MKKSVYTAFVTAALAAALLLMTTFSACVSRKAAVPEADPSPAFSPAVPAEQAEPVGTEAAAERADGERYEEVIILEGMEQTVRYEHVRNDSVGIEMDYDYDLFERSGGADSERFVSCYDLPNDPENYLDITYSVKDAEIAAASIGDALAADYEIIQEPFILGRAGSCIRIDASAAADGSGTPDHLLMVYIIPAADGCRVATAHYGVESAEGFGARFRYMMDTLAVIDSHMTDRIPGTWQTASMAYEADGTMYPEYYVRFTDSEIVYGHMKNGEFIFDHSDPIVLLDKISAGRWRIQAEASNGVRYTYQTGGSDDTVLEYFESWQEAEFPDTYRGGASLSLIY